MIDFTIVFLHFCIQYELPLMLPDSIGSSREDGHQARYRGNAMVLTPSVLGACPQDHIHRSLQSGTTAQAGVSETMVLRVLARISHVPYIRYYLNIHTT